MNLLLMIGFLVITGYFLGTILEKIGIPKIIGYITTGIIFSPNSLEWMPQRIISNTSNLLSISLAFIAFEVGGELRWNKIRKLEKEIVTITLMAGFIPFFLITGFFYFSGFLFPDSLPLPDLKTILVFSILLAALASPTDPSATLAVIHQYKAKGVVKDTILGVAALDDALGIFLFSFAIAVSLYILGDSGGIESSLLFGGKHIGGGLLTGLFAAIIMNLVIKYIEIKGEGQWIIIIFSAISLCYGVASYFDADALLACMVMGLIIANTSRKQQIIFNTIERYTEELIFLFFFILSGLQLDIHKIPTAFISIIIFVILRFAGKYLGGYLGGSLIKAKSEIKKYTAGGLIPQGGIVIGLALMVNQYSEFSELFDLLLTVVMGGVIINELIGPLTAKYSILKAKEISGKKK